MIKNRRIALVLLSFFFTIRSHEMVRISSQVTPDEEIGLLPSAYQQRSQPFLVHLNKAEINLARKYIKREMKWVEDFYKESFKNPEIIQTKAEEIAQKRQVIAALLDHIDKKIVEEKGKKWGQRALFCINPCCQDGPSECVDGCKCCCLIAGVLVGWTAWLSSLLIFYPSYAEGCILLNFADFMKTCVSNSTFEDTPFNVTQMKQEYGMSYYATALYPSCYNLSQQECKRLADQYNSHEYPKLEFRAWLPTIIGLPALVATCTALQLVSCKYRKWKKSSDTLRAEVDCLNNTIDEKITHMNNALNSYNAQKSLVAVD